MPVSDKVRWTKWRVGSPLRAIIVVAVIIFAGPLNDQRSREMISPLLWALAEL